MLDVQTSLLKKAVKDEEVSRLNLIQGEYRQSMDEYNEDSLLQLNIWAADKTDDDFWIVEHDMKSLGLQVEDVFRHPDHYARIPVKEPRKENAGKYVLQLLCPNGSENVDPKTIEIMERLANLGPMMEEMVRGNEGYTLDLYISTPDNVTLAMDNLSDGKFKEDGSIRDYIPSTRPWYKGAVETGGMFISSAVHSYFYDFNEVIFGYPIYVDGELVAVLEASTKLGVIEENMKTRNVGKEGFSVLISKDGQLVCSQREQGELALRDDLSEDIRTSVNPQLGEMIKHALSGAKDVDIITVDGEQFYAAHAPLETIGWTQFSFASVKEMTEPINNLVKDMEKSTDDTIKDISTDFSKHTVLLILGLLILMLIAILMASKIAKKRVRPIEQMSESVRSFVGENLEFKMQDVYKTGDEIQQLAESFDHMSTKMKEYLDEIIENTAEKERVKAEMEAATQIQKKMLPAVAPDFYGKNGYELFAKMETAKEVGGDLYDFYYLDDDRLVLMIGDVSGKGITAALFMALSKQMIKSQVLLHGGDLVEAMNEANKRLCEESVDAMFVTAWIGVLTLSTGALEFVNAGHVYAAVKRDNGEFVLEEDDHCVLMAGVDFAKYKLNRTTLNAGDVVYLYTDGVTEAHDKDDRLFGEERLLAALNEKADASCQELDEIVRRRVFEFAGETEQYDDITTVCFKYTGNRS
jgi:sigma-B regulation protein RsbU (phosphoserine phosphatase)